MRCIHPRLNGVYVLLHLLIRRAIRPWRFHKNRGRATAHAASNSTRSQKITSALNSTRYGVGRSYAYLAPVQRNGDIAAADPSCPGLRGGATVCCRRRTLPSLTGGGNRACYLPASQAGLIVYRQGVSRCRPALVRDDSLHYRGYIQTAILCS